MRAEKQDGRAGWALEREAAPVTVLLLARNSQWGGGVVNFVDMLSANLGAGLRVERHEIGRRPGDGGVLRRAVRPLADGLGLLRRLRTRRYAVVQLNPSLNRLALPRDALFMLAVRLAGLGPRSVVFFHGWDPGAAAAIRNHAPLRFLFGRLFGAAAKIVVLASRFKADLIAAGVDPERIEVLTTLFDAGIFGGAPPQRHTRAPGRRILFLGRLVREKGVYELLEAFRRVHRRTPDTELLLAGDGEERGNIERWIAANGMGSCVTLPGYVRGAEKGRMLADADVFVLPTRHGEGCPVALLEAMAAGLPVIASDVGGIPDVVKDGRNGVMLDEVTPEAVERALTEVLGNLERWRLAGRLNMHEAWRKYEAGIVASKLVAIYRSLI